MRQPTHHCLICHTTDNYNTGHSCGGSPTTPCRPSCYPSPPDPVMGFFHCSKHGEVIPRVQCTKCVLPPDPVSVSREAITRVLFKSGFITYEESHMVDDLLSLLSGQGRKREPGPWCPHLTWKECKSEEGGGYWFYEETMKNEYNLAHNVRPMEKWKSCPVCGAPRPEENGQYGSR